MSTTDQPASAARHAYAPGGWYGVFGAAATVLLPPEQKARVAALWELVDGGADFAEVLDAVISSGLRELPAFAILGPAGSGVRVVLRGPVSARFTAGGEEVTLDGSSAGTWVEATLDDVSALSVALDDAAGDAALTVETGLVRIGRVESGAAAAGAAADGGSGPVGAAVPVSAEPPPPPAPQAETPVAEPPVAPAEPTVAPAAEPTVAPVAEPDLWPAMEPSEPVAPTAQEPPAPSTEPDLWPAIAPETPSAAGLGAPAAPAAPPVNPPPAAGGGPFNPPPAAGTMPEPPAEPAVPSWDRPNDGFEHDGHTQAPDHDAIADLTSMGLPGQPEPPAVTARPVARLVFSSGQTVEVDRAVIVGRAPEARRFSSDEQPRLITVPSPQHEISSTHLEVRPGAGADHGSAVVTDMGSTNGTVLIQPGLPPEDLQPGIAVQLIPGAIIDLGDSVNIQVINP